MSLLDHLLQCAALIALGSAPIPLAAWIAARSEDSSDPYHLGHQWLVMSLMTCATHILVGVALGAVGLLVREWVFGIESAVLLVGVFVWWRHGSAPLRLLPHSEALSVHAGFFLVFWIVGAGLGWHVLRTPTENYDSYAYHLPAMTWWFQDGGFRFLPDLLHAAYYSYGWEVLCLLTFFPMHEDAFVAAPNVVIWATWALAIYLLARRAGAGSAAALMAAGLLLMTPTVLTRIDAAQPDIAVAAYFTAAIYFADIALRGRSAWAFALAAFSILLLPGLKMSGLVYAPILFVGMLVPRWMESWRQKRGFALPLEFQPKILLPFVAAGLFLGSYWYFRNIAHAGNPLGFLRIELFGSLLFDGDVTREELGRTALSAIFEPTRAEHWAVLWEVARDWLGLGFGLLLLFLFFLKRRSSVLLTPLLWILLLSALAYWTAPYSADNGNRNYQLTPWMNVGLRYAYPLFSIIAVLAAVGMERARIRGKIALVAPVFLASYVMMWKMKIGGEALRYAVGVGLPLSFYLIRLRRLPSWARKPYVTIPFAIIVLGLFGYKSLQLREAREAERQASYGVLHSYMEDKIARRASIAYIRTHRRYQLFGNDLSRRILWIVPEGDDPEAWIRKLREAGVEWVAVGTADVTESDRPGIADVRPWLEENSESFQMYFPAQNSRKDVALYRLIGGP